MEEAFEDKEVPNDAAQDSAGLVTEMKDINIVRSLNGGEQEFCRAH